MKNRILKKKLLFLHHLETMDKSSLANQVYQTQLQLKLPGIMDVCNDFLVKFNLSNIKSYSKLKWKEVVKQNIDKLNKSDLLSKMTNLSKLDQKSLSEEKVELKVIFES